MNDINKIQQIRREASELRKKEKYYEAVDRYASLWANHNADSIAWDGWGYAFSLRKLGRSQEALAICKDVYNSKPDFNRIRDLYGWCLYDLKIARKDKGTELDEVEFLKAADDIVRITVPGQYSPYVRTVMKVLEHYNLNSS